jgi:hypothetical protein
MSVAGPGNTHTITHTASHTLGLCNRVYPGMSGVQKNQQKIQKMRAFFANQPNRLARFQIENDMWALNTFAIVFERRTRVHLIGELQAKIWSFVDTFLDGPALEALRRLVMNQKIDFTKFVSVQNVPRLVDRALANLKNFLQHGLEDNVLLQPLRHLGKYLVAERYVTDYIYINGLRLQPRASIKGALQTILEEQKRRVDNGGDTPSDDDDDADVPYPYGDDDDLRTNLHDYR